ncbi:MAG: sigma-70 family RNA polymerase sigma factor [Lachnospiraceae bacterium]|nr:sigma-70 family RNA polymerase sigma factor [Lachnospiraceae bacterium]
MGTEQEKLVRDAQAGDKDAFAALLRENEQRMFKVARSFLSCEDDIADVMQESVLQAYLHMSDLKQPAYFRTWLVRIVINQCKSVLAKQRKVICVDEIREQGYEELEYDKIAFVDLMDRLDEKYRQIMLLYYGEGYSTAEISDLLGMKQSTVCSRLARGRKCYLDISRQDQIV